MFGKFKRISRSIGQSKKILLHLHPSPDGDSVGSALATLFVLKQLHKQVTIISGDSELPQNLSILPGFKEIKNQNFLQTDLSQFDLFLILDSSSKSMITRLGEVKFPKKLKTIVIDHHSTNEKFADINFIEKNKIATCEILYDLFKALKIKITPNIAANLFVGIYIDSGGFKYSLTTSRTFVITAELTKIYPKFSSLIFFIENHNRPDQLKFLSVMLSSIETFFSDRVAISSIPFEDIAKYKINSSTIINSEIPNILKSVIGWDIGISLIESQPNITKISLRTRDPLRFDVGKISLATGFGGGHRAAAGAILNSPLNEAKKIILDTIQKVYPEIK